MRIRLTSDLASLFDPDLVTVPHNWLCVDCGINTAPLFPSREEVREAFKRQGFVDAVIDNQSEVYSVRPAVWEKAGMEPSSGCLCIGCLEKRLGRHVKRKDFSRDHEFNHPNIPGTPRLKNRRKDRR